MATSILVMRASRPKPSCTLQSCTILTVELPARHLYPSEPRMKNITLSADENLIEAARRRTLSAAAERTTLNAQFRLWLADYVGRERQAARESPAAVLRELRGSISTGGRKFTREEMNER